MRTPLEKGTRLPRLLRHESEVETVADLPERMIGLHTAGLARALGSVLDCLSAVIVGGASLSGGRGTILGSFLGAAFIVMVPIFLTNVPHLLGVAMPVALQKQIELMVFGGLIILFLIVEPHGLARLWQISKEKLRLWPFPY